MMLLTVVATTIGQCPTILVESGRSGATVTVDASICRCCRCVAVQASAGLLLGSSAFHTYRGLMGLG